MSLRTCIDVFGPERCVPRRGLVRDGPDAGALIKRLPSQWFWFYLLDDVRAASWGPPGERPGRGTPATRYLLNERDCIAWVGGSWDAFAAENGAPELQGREVIGASVFSFIADVPTQSVYQRLYRSVRQGRRIAFPLRCDSPRMRREMLMVMEPEPAGYIDVQVMTLRLMPTRFVPFWLGTPGGGVNVVVACGWCKRLRLGEEWYAPEVLADRMQLSGNDALPRISHGICPACESEILKTLD